MGDNNPYKDANYITVAAPAAVVKGQGVFVGGIFGLATGPAASGADVTLAVTGTHIVPKNASLVITRGDVLYWDAGEAAVNKTASGNYKIGTAATSELSAATTVEVRLDGTSVVVGA